MPELQIDKLAYGGAGFGRLGGKACFVPFTAPGDLVEVRIEKNKSSYTEGVVEKILSSSSHRISPRCPVFGICGGCNWQHVSYMEQCRQKELIFADTLWRSARVEKEKIKPVISAASQFEYRQRIQLKINYTGGKLSLGFHQRSSHHVIDIGDQCAIAAKTLNLAIPRIRDIISSFNEPFNISQVDLASSSDNSVSALFHYIGNFPDELAAHLEQAEKDFTTLHSICMQIGNKNTFRHIGGLEKLKYTVPTMGEKNLELYYSPDSFSQVNFAQNRVIVQLLLDYCSKVSPDSILDLFCGNGNFSIPLAGMARNILGFESVRKSISLAEYNATLNGAANARYICKDSREGVEDIARSGEIFDLVIMDPPRTGADEVSKIVYKTGAANLIYISCDPPTLGRDISNLQKNGFEVISIQPVDMFPQTYHLESIVFLKAV
jgi:23S rRNA (uracil1939-C5)-methyltransferase